MSTGGEGDGAAAVRVIVPPQPKSETCSIAEYLEYFEAVATANTWDDALKARIFPALLGIGNTVLTDCPEADRKSFVKIKAFLTKVGEPYRDAYMIDLFRVRKSGAETIEKYRDRVVTMVEQVYPRFAASNKATLARDFFICGLPDTMRSAVLNSGSCRKLEEAVNSALMCYSLSDRLAPRGAGAAASGGHVTQCALRGPPSPVGRGRGGDPARPAVICWRCGVPGHRQAQCRAPGARPGTEVRGRRLDGIAAAASPMSADGRIDVDVDIDGKAVRLLADSGATISCLPPSFQPNAASAEEYVTAANGSQMTVYGVLRCSVTIGGGTRAHDFLITDVQRGVVGADLLQKFGASVDFDRRAVLVSVSGAAADAGSDGMDGGPGGVEAGAGAPSAGCGQYSGGTATGASSTVAPGAPSADCVQLLQVGGVEAPVLDWEEGDFHEIAMLLTGEDLMSECDFHTDRVQSSPSLESIKREFGDVFSGLGRTSLIEHKIETTNERPVVCRPHRLPAAYKERAQIAIDQMLRDGVIEPSDSDYMNPVVLVKKKSTDDIRVCIDFRALNEVTVKDRQPVPLVSEVLAQLAEARVFSVLDARSGYYQIPLREQDRKKTAFQFNGQLLQFRMMPFGLCNGPSTFNRLVHKLTWDLPCVAAYFDDWCVHSSDVTSHMDDLRSVLQRLREAGLTLNGDKCKFLMTSLESFLGFSIEGGAVRPTEEHTRAIDALRRPEDQASLRRFLGLCGFYRSHISKFSLIARPLHDLLQKGKSFFWDGAHEKAFRRLKSLLAERPALKLPTEKSLFSVRTDASEAGFGCVLEADGQPVEFSSKAFNKSQRNYSVIEKEACAIVHALKRWRHILIGRPVLLFTDHKPLQWLRSKKDLTGRLGRWALLLEEFDVQIQHVSGAEHVVPDTLSRSLPAESPCVASVADWRSELADDEAVRQLQEQKPTEFMTNQRGALCHLHPTFGEQLVVPKSQRDGIIRTLHADQLAGHTGSRRTIRRVQERYFWPGMTRDIKQFVKACHICCTVKDTPVPTAPLVPVDTSVLNVWEKVAIDIVGPIMPRSESGARFIVVCQDYFSKWPELVSLPSTETAVIQQWLFDDVFCRHGFPSEIVTDQGTQWMSASFRQFCEKLGIKHRVTSPYHPQSDMVERFNRTLLNMIRSYVDEHKECWDQNLQSLAFAYRTAVCETTHATPFELVFCRRAQLPLDKLHSSMRSVTDSGLMGRLTDVRAGAREVSRRAAVKRAKNYDDANHVKVRELKIGKEVYWKRPINQAGVSPKLQPIWSGPFVVAQKMSDVNYRIRDDEGKSVVVHVNNLKACHASHVTAGGRAIIRKRGRPKKQNGRQ